MSIQKYEFYFDDGFPFTQSIFSLLVYFLSVWMISKCWGDGCLLFVVGFHLSDDSVPELMSKLQKLLSTVRDLLRCINIQLALIASCICSRVIAFQNYMN